MQAGGLAQDAPLRGARHRRLRAQRNARHLLERGGPQLPSEPTGRHQRVADVPQHQPRYRPPFEKQCVPGSRAPTLGPRSKERARGGSRSPDRGPDQALPRRAPARRRRRPGRHHPGLPVADRTRPETPLAAGPVRARQELGAPWRRCCRNSRPLGCGPARSTDPAPASALRGRMGRPGGADHGRRGPGDARGGRRRRRRPGRPARPCTPPTPSTPAPCRRWSGSSPSGSRSPPATASAGTTPRCCCPC